MTTINYKANKTARKLHKSNKFVRGIMGPVGSGKTVACINEVMLLMIRQKPNDKGIRPTRFTFVRNTYDELRKTTLNTFKDWFPSEICTITLNPAIVATVKFPLPDGTMVESEVYFTSMDKPDDAKKVLSLEISGAFVNEAREIPYEIITAIRSRIGRYPSIIASGVECTQKSLLMDTNPPDTTHWWYQLAEQGRLKDDMDEKASEKTAEIFDFFRSPPPLIKTQDGYEINPDADNIDYLPGKYKYYLDMTSGNSQDWIDVMVLGNYGMLKSGMPVYNEYNDQWHLSKQNLGVITGYPVAVGWDWGRDCAAVFGQLMPNGQLRIFAELVGIGTHIRQFVRDIVKPFIDQNLYDVEWAFSYGDPAGVSRKGESGLSFFEILNDEYLEMDGALYQPLDLPFYTEPAPTNKIDARIDAVKQFIGKVVSGGHPGYLLSPKCEFLRKGKMGGYAYRQLNVGGSAKYSIEPDKNEYSHPADAEQYLALGFISQYGIMHNDYNNYSLPKPRPNNSMGY